MCVGVYAMGEFRGGEGKGWWGIGGIVAPISPPAHNLQSTRAEAVNHVCHTDH